MKNNCKSCIIWLKNSYANYTNNNVQKPISIPFYCVCMFMLLNADGIGTLAKFFIIILCLFKKGKKENDEIYINDSKLSVYTFYININILRQFGPKM